MKFLEEKFVPIAAKIGSQKHLVAIRDGFVVVMPATICWCNRRIGQQHPLTLW